MLRIICMLLICACAISGQSDIHEGSKCILSNGNDGTCALFKDCPEAQNDVKKSRRPVVCTFSGFEPIVCCSQPAATPRPPAKSETPPATSQPAPDRTSGSKAEQKCKEYSEFVYVLEQSFIPGDPPIKNDECGVPFAVPAIIDGEPASMKEFPHMAAIGYDTKNGRAWLCGGTLISERFVLTAAHCLSEKNENGVSVARYVRLGEVDIVNSTESQTEDFKVKRTIQYPTYRYPKKFHDIGLVELDREVKFSPFIRPACLQTQKNLPTESVIITGWGKTDYLQFLLKEGGSYHPTLQKAVISEVKHEQCSEKFRNIQDDTMLCAGTLKGTKDACQGDSGGPLQYVREEPYCMYSVSGVTSYGYRCGEPGYPAVYTRVSHFVPWIESIVWPN